MESFETWVLCRVAQMVVGRDVPGSLPMELENKVEFSRAMSYTPTGQADGRVECFEANPATIGCCGRHRMIMESEPTRECQES